MLMLLLHECVVAEWHESERLR